MTPMIDVVFLLIIFFLVSSHLAQRENRIPVLLPAAGRGQFDEPNPDHRLTLTLQDDGRVWWGGRTVPVDELTELLRSQVQEYGNQLQLRIRCDRRLTYRYVEAVLASAARAGLWNLSFAVIEPSGVAP